MQVLQRLFKLVQEKQNLNPSVANKKGITCHTGEKEKEIIHGKNQKARKRHRKCERINLDCSDMNKHLASFLRRENLRACFSNTLYVYSVKIKKEDIIQGLARSGHTKPGYPDQSASSSPATIHPVGNKVLPVSDTSTTSSSRRHAQNEKGRKFKAMSKMKELLRWSSSAKSQKGGKHSGIKFQDTHFRITESAKGSSSGDDEPITESPKISFQISTISAGTASCLVNADGGNWITTDDEFVVLELLEDK